MPKKQMFMNFVDNLECRKNIDVFFRLSSFFAQELACFHLIGPNQQVSILKLFRY